MDGEVALTGLERDPLRHRPARQRALPFEAKVVVEAARVVTLDDEERLLAPFRPLPAEGLRRLLPPALAFVLRELGHVLRMPRKPPWARRFSPPQTGRRSNNGMLLTGGVGT